MTGKNMLTIFFPLKVAPREKKITLNGIKSKKTPKLNYCNIGILNGLKYQKNRMSLSNRFQ